MRAPTFTPTFAPIHAYKERFSAPDGAALAQTIGRVLVAGGSQQSGLRAAIEALSDDTAGRARALQDCAALNSLVDAHAGLQGGSAVAAQPQALDALARIRSDGQATLATPQMIAAYDQQIGPAIDDAANRITGHALQQAGVERQAVADQAMQSAQQSAASAWANPARFVQGLSTVQALAADRAWPEASDEDRARAMRTAVGGAVAGAIGQALSGGDPEFAANILSGWGGSLSPADYQLSVARLGQAAYNQRMAAIFAQAAGGNPSPAVDAPATLSPDAVSITAPAGAAVHPVAGGSVTSVDGVPGNVSVQIAHPDGSSTTYGGVGLSAVAPGDLVTPLHVIGSAGPLVTLTATTPAGEPSDAATLLHNAGGGGALIGATDTPRIWDMPTMLDRIALRQDLSPVDQALASSFARRRIADDQAQQTANDQAAGRALVSLVAATPNDIAQAADLPSALAAQMSPAMLAQTDVMLRRTAQSPTIPAPGNADALRLALLQRQAPSTFAQTNLVPYIGLVHPDDLSQLAAAQSGIAAGEEPQPPQDRTGLVLDALARHEFTNGVHLSDDALPAITGQAATLLRLNQTDLSDRPAIDSAVADAIQSQTASP